MGPCHAFFFLHVGRHDANSARAVLGNFISKPCRVWQMVSITRLDSAPRRPGKGRRMIGKPSGEGGKTAHTKNENEEKMSTVKSNSSQPPRSAPQVGSAWGAGKLCMQQKAPLSATILPSLSSFSSPPVVSLLLFPLPSRTISQIGRASCRERV